MEFILDFSRCVFLGPKITDTEMQHVGIVLVSADYAEDAAAIGESLKIGVVGTAPHLFEDQHPPEAVDSLDCEVTPLEDYLNRLRNGAKSLHEHS